LPVFTRPESVGIVLESWKYPHSHDAFRLFGDVILENHLHLIASASDLTAVMKRFKSHTAKPIIELLESRRAETLLHQLRIAKRRHKTHSDYQVWEEGSHPQQLSSEKMMRQKLDSIHANPVASGYVDDPTHWRMSSARNYEGLPAMIDVVPDWNS
jgi:putative transposase